MFIRVIRQAFVRWWDKMGYTFLTSLLGAVNPFYLYIIYVTIGWLTAPDKTPFFQASEQFLLFLPAIILAAPVFPLTFAAIGIQKQVIENETVYYRRYFPDYFSTLRRIFLPSLALLPMYIAAGFFMSYAGIFYYKMLPVPGLKIAVLVVLFWLYLVLLMSQYVLLPLIIYNPELKLRQAVKISFQMVLAQGLNIFLIGLLDLILNIFLILSRALGILFYYGISSHLRIYMHKEIVARYAPAQPESQEEHYDRIDATRNWAEVLKKIKEKD